MTNNQEIWEAISAPLDKAQIKTREQGNTKIRYISRDAVIYRLNQVCPGEWNFQVEMIAIPGVNGATGWVAKGTLTICGVVREDFGIPENGTHFDPPKSAASDALKRCASQFGFALELYGPEPAPQNGNGGSAKHWTLTQDWAKFWIHCSELGLDEADVHAAIELDSVEAWKGSKKELMDILNDASVVKYANELAEGG